jgi:DNA-binding CsgD family transcriptional regulator
VGRAHELRRLRTALANALDGGSVAFILGEPGIGKSRLLAELSVEDGLTPSRVLLGRCTSVSALATPYAPFTSAFRTLWTVHGQAWFKQLRSGGRDLAPIVPGLARSRADEPDGDARTALQEAAREALALAAADGPVLLGIEDVHWATESTLGLITSLVADPPAGLLLVMTAREDGLPSRVAALIGEALRSPGVDVIRLPPLTDDEVARFVLDVSGRLPGSEAVRELRRRSGGNPFLLEEVMHGDGNGNGDFAANLGLRLSGLGVDATRAARLVALHGEPLLVSILQTASELDDDRLADAVAACTVAGLLVAEARAPLYRFRHDLIQEAIRDAIPPVEARALHAKLAAAIRAIGSADAATAGRAARHWLAAGDPAAAFPLLLDAARSASRNGAFPEAVLGQEAALRAWRQVPGGSTRSVSEARLLGDLANYIGLTGDTAHAARQYEAAIAASLDPEERMLLVADRVQLLWNAGLEEDARPLRREVAALGTRLGTRIRSLDLLAVVVRAMVAESRFADAEPLGRLAVARSQAEGRPDVEPVARAALGLALGLSGRPAEGIHELTVAAELSAASGHHTQLLLCAGNLVALLAEHEHREAVMRAIRRWRRVAESRGFGLLLDAMDTALLDEYVWLGQWAQAESLIADLESRGSIHDNVVARIAIARSELAVRRGRGDAADKALELAAHAAATLQQAHHRGELTYWQVRRMAEKGDTVAAVDAATAELTNLVQSIEGGVWYELLSLAVRIASQAVRVSLPGSRVRLARLFGLERQRRAWNPPAVAPSSVAACRLEMRAELSERHGQPSAVMRRAAAEVRERMARPAEAAEAWLRAATAFYTDGEVAEAHKALQHAVRIADRLGLEPVHRAAHELRVSRDRRRRSAVALARGTTLTRREVDVLGLIAEGRTNREIATALHIGEKTVATHVSNVLAKLGSARRTDAAVAAVRIGLLVDGPPADPVL